jgi:hypothetical protein
MMAALAALLAGAMLQQAIVLATLQARGSVRVWPVPLTPFDHPLHHRSHTAGAGFSVFTPIPGRRLPGWAALRVKDTDLDDLTTLWHQIDHYVGNNTGVGDLDVANALWPSSRIVFHPNFTAFARQLKARHIPIVDLGGFCPSAGDQFDVNNGDPGGAIGFFPANSRVVQKPPRTVSYLDEGRAILNAPGTDPLLLGLDMGEQDDRYIYSYSLEGVLAAGSGSHFEQYRRFREFSDEIERSSGGTMASLVHSPWATHYYHKTGLYTTGGSETSSSGQNAQSVYSFIRGASKQYGTTVYGQVSVFNGGISGYKTYGFGEQPCVPNGHGPACGTSLSLMKRLLFTEMWYDSVYFAFEGGWEFGPVEKNLTGLITPIGTLQAGAKKFFSSEYTPDLGVHVPTIAVLLDYYGGWRRPCDGEPYDMSVSSPPRNWGVIPWDLSDFAVDYVFERILPGYRTHDTNDERGHLVPTPFGDAADTLLSDVLLSVLAQYDTVVAPHRLTTEPDETQRKLALYVQGGGKLYITASTVLDLGGKLLDVSIEHGCKPAQYAGQNISLCPLTVDAKTPATASKRIEVEGQLAAVELTYPSGGVLRIVGVGNYGLAGELNDTVKFACGTNYDQGQSTSPYKLVQFADQMLLSSLQDAALFDLGTELSWVPRRVNSGHYSLLVVNNEFESKPLVIRSMLGPIASITELHIGQQEKSLPFGQGWLPFGFDNATVRTSLGVNTATIIQGLDTRAFLVQLSSDSSTPIDPLPPPATPTPRRLLRLSHGIGPVRNELLRRPSFRNFYDGIVLDWGYLEARSEEALQREARWWGWQKLQVVVDFTSGTTIFPGPLRMMDDYWYNGTGIYGTGPLFTRSMARLTAVLKKMPLVGARDALLTLHGPGGDVLPANVPKPDFIELFRQTFVRLEAIATPLNVTLHLRDTGRNGILRQTSNGSPPLNLSVQVDFVRSICGVAASTGAEAPSPCVKVAPAFAYNASLADVSALVADGTATLLLLSAEANDQNAGCKFSTNKFKNGQDCKMRLGPYPGGPRGGNSFAGPTEGSPLLTLSASGRARLREWTSIGAATLVLDAVPAFDGESGRAAELADVVLLE